MNDIVLLTGITGFLGGHIAVELLNAGYSVRGSLRNPGANGERAEATRKALDQITSSGRVAGGLVTDATVEHFIEKGALLLYTGWMSWVGVGARGFLDKVAVAS